MEDLLPGRQSHAGDATTRPALGPHSRGREVQQLRVGGDEAELLLTGRELHGADDLVSAVAAFQPGAHRRLGVLLDHLVAGSKESRLAAAVDDSAVLITGHPYVDVWAGIRPRVLGLERWPDVPKGQPWKQGLCAALGVEVDGFWPKLRNRVRSYADLEPELVGAVERLIDFVSA